MTQAQAPRISNLDDGTTSVRRDVVNTYLAHIEQLRLKGGEFYYTFIFELKTGPFPISPWGALTQGEVNEILALSEGKAKAPSASEIERVTRQRVDHELAQIGLPPAVHPPQRHSDAGR